MKNPAKIPGMIYGSITFDKMSQLLAPRSRAASIKDELISCNLGKTMMTTIGTLNAIWDNKTEMNPSLIPISVNKIKKDAPIITSGLTIKTLFSVCNVFFVRRLFTYVMASAPRIPRMVDIAADNRAMINVFNAMINHLVSWNTP